jgi:hypothetical protein
MLEVLIKCIAAQWQTEMERKVCPSSEQETGSLGN